MRHRDNNKQQHTYYRRKHDTLNAPELRRCQQPGQPMLEHPHSEQRRLKTRAMTRRLRDLEQKLAVSIGIAERADNSIVAVHLDCEAEPA